MQFTQLSLAAIVAFAALAASVAVPAPENNLAARGFCDDCALNPSWSCWQQCFAGSKEKARDLLTSRATEDFCSDCALNPSWSCWQQCFAGSKVKVRDLPTKDISKRDYCDDCALNITWACWQQCFANNPTYGKEE